MCNVMGSKFSRGIREYFVFMRTPEEDLASFLSNTQNHRMVGVGRDLWVSSSPTPLPEQGHLQQAVFPLLLIKDGPDPLITSRVTIKLPSKVKKKLITHIQNCCMANLQPYCLVLLPVIPSPSKWTGQFCLNIS